jgi:hypothetical protein
MMHADVANIFWRTSLGKIGWAAAHDPPDHIVGRCHDELE